MLLLPVACRAQGEEPSGSASVQPATKMDVPSKHCRLLPKIFLAFHAELQPPDGCCMAAALSLSSQPSKAPCEQLSLAIP